MGLGFLGLFLFAVGGWMEFGIVCGIGEEMSGD